jgi:hypothetical protein
MNEQTATTPESSPAQRDAAVADQQPSTIDQLLSSPLSTKDCTALAKLDSAPPVAINSGAVTSGTSGRKLRRNGRIARLPKTERDMVNRMLWNAVPYKNIVEALDSADFKVPERNISSWATGGYLEWQLEQEAVLENRLNQDHLLDFLRRDDAPELPEVGLQAAATRLSQVLLQKLARADDPEARVSPSFVPPLTVRHLSLN